MMRNAFSAKSIVLVTSICILSIGSIVRAGESGQSGSNLSEWSFEDLTTYKLKGLDVMGAHTHHKGEWMVGYQLMSMSMNGNVDGTADLSLSTVFNSGYRMSPTKMHMNMNMVDIMYAPSDATSLMLMIPYITKSMDIELSPMMGGGSFRTESQGIGDISFWVIQTVMERGEHRLLLTPGVSIPTGSIKQTDFSANPMMGEQQLPYPMQIGSGSFRFHPSITYLGEFESWNVGVKFGGSASTGENQIGYKAGSELKLNTWVGVRATDWFSPSLSIESNVIGDIVGNDPLLNPMMTPTADPKLRSGSTSRAMVGLNFLGQSGILENQRLVFEAGAPFYQSLDGPALETDWVVKFRLARTF